MASNWQSQDSKTWERAQPIGPRIVGWRDIDSERPQFGFRTWAGGAELRIGRRVYRWRVTR